MATERSERRTGTAPGSVALFIDWDNFAIGLRQEMPDRAADVGPILRWARRFGVLTVCRAYGEWRDPQERLAIYNAGVEVVYAPVLPLGGSVVARSGAGGAKSLADTAMAVDVTEALSLMPSITSVILATSDKDLIPVLRFAQRRGLHAVVVGSDRTAGALRDLADEFISYRQLLDQEVPAGTQSRPAMVPPVRYPRAPRTAALPAPAGEPVRRGRFEPREGRPPRSVITPIIPPVAPPPVAEPAAGTPGSVFADGEEEPTAGTSAARRRRRGGRRRRGHEVTGAGEVGPAMAAGEGEEEEEGEEQPAVQEAVQVAPGALAAEGPRAVETAETEPAAAPAAAERAPARRSPIVPAPGGARRGPVVLPGERLRRLASAAPEPEAGGPPAPEPEPAAPSEEETGAAAAPAAKSAAKGAGSRRRGGRTSATKSAAKASTASESPGEAAGKAASADDEESEAAEEGEAGAAPAAVGTRPTRGRRRGGRAR